MSMIFASILLLFFGRRSATTDRALNRNAQCWAIYSVTATPSSFILSPVVFRYEICHTAASCVCSCMANIDEFASRPNWHFSCSKINKSKSTSGKNRRKKQNSTDYERGGIHVLSALIFIILLLLFFCAKNKMPKSFAPASVFIVHSGFGCRAGSAFSSISRHFELVLSPVR